MDSGAASSIDYDYIMPHIHAIIRDSVPKLLVPVPVVVRAITLQCNLARDPMRLPKIWTWLLFGECLPPRLPPVPPKDVYPAYIRIRLRRFCEQRSFLLKHQRIESFNALPRSRWTQSEPRPHRRSVELPGQLKSQLTPQPKQNSTKEKCDPRGVPLPGQLISRLTPQPKKYGTKETYDRRGVRRPGQHKYQLKPLPKQNCTTGTRNRGGGIARCVKDRQTSATDMNQCTPSSIETATNESPLWSSVPRKTLLVTPIRPGVHPILPRKSPSPVLESPCPTGRKPYDGWVVPWPDFDKPVNNYSAGSLPSSSERQPTQDSPGNTSSHQHPLPLESAAKLSIPFLLNPSPNTFSSHTRGFDTLSKKADLEAMTNKKKPRKVAAGIIPPTLPPSVEEAYRKKCIELKRRMTEVEQSNDSFRLRKTRLLRGIRKMRLERTILLDILGKRMRKNGANGVYDSDSEGSSEGPPTARIQPHDKPLRSKRGHRRQMGSPPPGHPSQMSGPIAAASNQQPLPAFQSPYAPRQDASLLMYQPNGLPPPPHNLPTVHDLYPSNDSQVYLAPSAYHFFLQENYLNRDEVARHYRSAEEIDLAARSAWAAMTPSEIGTWMATYNERLDRWRRQMHEHAQITGEQLRGSFHRAAAVTFRGAEGDEEMVDREEMADREEAEHEADLERRREEAERGREREEMLRAEEERGEARGGRPMSGGFTSING